MMMILGGVFYLLFAVIIAFLLKNKRLGFWVMFFLSLIFTPLLMAVMGLIFSGDKAGEETQPG
jgi:hypothetical protein